MNDHLDQRQIRVTKLETLQGKGINPYPYSFQNSHTLPELLEIGKILFESQEEISISGRLMALRGKGKAVFANIQAQHQRLQIYIRKDEVGEDSFDVFGMCDIGDFLGLQGTMMHTKTGELTLRVKNLQILTKAVRPMPVPKVQEKDGEKIIHDEVRDKEFRYRQRYVDLTLNPEVAKVFRQRNLMMQTIRSYLNEQGFLEVETPTLQPVYGGANASPFTTHHKALDQTFFLRIANELYLKRLISGGFDAVFEFTKNFRNEGIDRTHNPEFSALEFYQANVDYTKMMEHSEQIFSRCAMALHGSMQFEYEGQMLDVTPPWKKMSMYEALQELADIDVESMEDQELQNLLENEELKLEGNWNRGLAIQLLFEEKCEKQLIQPTFITGHPKETSPLCKEHRENPDLIERFEAFINGWELANAYSELNDPLLQRKLMEEQVERGRGGESETQPLDEDFLRCVEYGMPPMGGIGFGIDRMVMLLTGQTTIRDVILFPTMRPEQ